ncbi:MAG: FtsQ-type POTRA domain-containing protein [Saprospiraceae bacterium]|nr:FtsQ-type POTRA domain-containing protein [Saprospiraceae bacterium]
MLKRIFILSISLILLSLSANSQSYKLYLKNNSSKQNTFISKLNYKKEFTLKNNREKELYKILNSCYESGYIAAGFDSLINDSNNLTAYINPGEKYDLIVLRAGNVDKEILNEINYKEKLFSNRTFKYTEIFKLHTKIIKYCENNGYPFASVKFDSLKISSNSVEASLNLNKGNKITIDSILIKGNSKITPRYIYNFINIKPGEAYNEFDIKQIETKLKELPFVRKIKPTSIVFTEENANIYLFLNKKPASQFDGFIGFLPNNNTTGKLMVNGDVHLKLLNSFDSGEMIDLNWRKLEKNTQDLKFNFVYPYLFNTPFGIDYKFKLFKKDTTYLTINNNLGIQFLFGGNNYLKIFTNNYKSSLVNTTAYENATVLPDFADISTTLFGIEYNQSKLDYLYNPRKGFKINLSAAAGNKKINKNDNVNQSLYDSLKLKTTQYQFEFDGGIFIPILKTSTILINNKSAYIANSNLFENELYRIGGLKDLRGFDEESINASLFSIFLLEYRYLFEENSYINIFCNAAYYEKNTTSSFIVDRPFGFGAGLSFQTKAGIFSINYALGKQFNNPIEFKSGKIHFGIVNYF